MSHRRLFLTLTLLLLSALVPLSASASYYDSFPIQSGFSHAKVSPDDTGAGLLLEGGGAAIRRGSPTIAEIDGNTGNGKEIAVGGMDGWLYVYHKNGVRAWRQQVLPGGVGSCSFDPATDGIINSAPAVGELFGDGVPYVVVGYGTINTSCIGGVVAYDGRNGNLKWRYQLTNTGETLHGVISSPALVDVDGDGKLEVGFGNFERDMVMLTSNGIKLWRYHNKDTVWSSPAFADATGDGLPDMIIGSDISANSKLKPPEFDGGYVTALRGYDGLGNATGDGPIWRHYFDQTIFSSPAVADLDGNGVKEVIVGSGCFFSPATKGHWLKILDIRNGNEIRTLNAAGCLSSSPALGDIDGDGKLEIVASVNGAYVGGPGLVQAWDYDNPTPKWTIDPRDSFNNNDQFIDDIQSPVLADLDGNGSLEVIIANIADVVVLRGSNGQQLTCRGCITGPGKAMFTLRTVKSTPAVGDIDNDGDLEVVIGGSGKQGTDAYLYVWTDFAGQLGSAAGSLPSYSAPWPMFRGKDPKHTGIFVEPALRASATAISLLVEQGAPARTLHIGITDAAEGAIDWTATDNQSWISLGDTGGTTPATLDVTIDPSSLGLGTHTGTISFASSFGNPEIDVTVRVVDQVFTLYLPVAQR